MEACRGSHFLGRALRERGHEVRLIPAQYVKPYVKTNKSDYIDAEAIAEAVGRPTMRFVPIKSDDQLDMQSLHRVRERWVMRRTAVVNQIRGLLLERGITVRKGRCHLDAALPGLLEDASINLSGAVRLLLAQLKLELDQLTIRLEEADVMIQKAAQESEVCRRLDAIPGIGPLTATALIAATTVEPGALQTRIRKKSFETALLMGKRARRIPSWPGAAAPTKAVYICAD
jgi:transposase